MKKVFSLCLCLFLIGCESKEIKVNKIENGFVSNHVQTIEKGYVPWVSNQSYMNFYQIGNDGNIYIEQFDEKSKMSTHKMNSTTFEIEWNITKAEEILPISNARFLYKTKDYAVYEKNVIEDDKLIAREYYYVDENEIILLAEIEHSFENYSHPNIYQPYYDEINDKGYIAIPKNDKCIIYEIKDKTLIENKQIDIFIEEIELCGIDVHNMVFTYNNNVKKKVIYESKEIDLMVEDEIVIIGDYLFITPYRVDENIRVIHLKTNKEKILDKSIEIPKMNTQYEHHWTIKDDKYSFIYYSKKDEQYVHATFDGKNMNLVLLGLKENDRYLQLDHKSILFIIDNENTEEIYKVEIK